jgi:alkanesulfonate monooxygenase SsuD/methylene tetrahydromethanopterin reductase-like flavin-dependent oxidoreductase (luciferase family)
MSMALSSGCGLHANLDATEAPDRAATGAGAGGRGMKFGIFDYLDRRDEPEAQTFDERMALLRAAEDAGFHGYHLTEHHVSPLSLAPSPTVFLAAAARETRRLRLGTLLYLLPLYHPVRLIEELCMLDHLSGGRLDIGVGTGVSPFEFAALGADFATAREQFEENFAILYQGLTQDRLEHRGSRHRIDGLTMVMRPLQRPLPPLWYGLRSDYGHDLAAAYGMNVVALGTDERVAATLARFRTAWDAKADERRLIGTGTNEPLIGAMRAVFVAETDAAAERIAGPAHQQWFDNLVWLWKENGTYPPIALSPDFTEATRSGALVAGSPATVRRKLVEQARRIGFNYLVLHLAFGSLGHAQEMRSLALFRDEVMPALVDLGATVAAK